MPFNDVQANLQQVRRALEAQEKAVFHARESIKRIGLEKRKTLRSHSVDSESYQALDAQEKRSHGALSRQQAQLASSLEEYGALLREFEAFADPRENIGQLPDDRPILLFPLRLETRFRIVGGRDGGQQHQLWVRVFPDVCSIDSFDDTLSSSEIERAKNYWVAVWRAGAAGGEAVEALVRDRRVGAWRSLMGSFNAGRAYWITQNYRPTNEADLPSRNDPADVLLIIPTEDPPAAPLRGALETYWEAVFTAGGDPTQTEDALDALMAAAGVDEAAARALVEQYVPQNLFEEVPGAGAAVRAVFIVFPQSPAKLNAWSQAARVRTFPEKFVLLGYEDGNDAPVIQEVGRTIPDPLIVGPDTRDDIDAVLREVYGEAFDTWTDDEKATSYIDYLRQRADTRWLFDFDAAIDMGLGFKVDLTPAQYRRGFRRLFVLGVKLSLDADAGGEALSELLRHHQFGDSGFSIVSQGTPTNNTEESGSGFSVAESPEEAFDRYFGDTPPDDPGDAATKRDGRHLAEMLGIDPDAAALRLAENYFGRDQAEARAMHLALWNATLGFYLESMVTPVTTESTRDRIRGFLTDHVRGGGRIPAIRIANQPYGILPISDVRNLDWVTEHRPGGIRDVLGHRVFLRGLYGVLSTVRGDWELLLDQVAYVGKEGDPHQILLQALGLNPQSVEYDRRIAESFQQIKNSLYAQGVLGDDIDQLDVTYRAAGMQLLEHLGYEHNFEVNPPIPILDRCFLVSSEDVTKPPIDDRPLSEEEPIRAYTDDGLNYIGWLVRNARENHRNIKDEKGFTGDKRPVAILYDLLRHAVNLGFGNTGLNLYREAELLTQSEVATAQLDAEFIGIESETTALESKWDITYRLDDRITGTDELIVERISSILLNDEDEDAARDLQEVIAALELLEGAPTARLERCLAEHIDCCSYRLDAWLLGFLHLQLDAMRAVDGDEFRRGVYIGAYGWVENLVPENKVLSPVTLDEPLREIFDPENEGGIVRDSTNAGYVHAPSVNHAVTAAVLRNAYISTAEPADAERYKVNLSSERVRLALAVIEGMQQGQSLGALLGYQLERGLHDHNTLELDVYIYELRKVFPLAGNRLRSTAVEAGKVGDTPEATARHAEEAEEMEEDRAISKIEAHNVVDGLALLDHIAATGDDSYPFGFEIGVGAGKLKDATGPERDAIDAEVERLMNIRDAVADLAIAESVHQVVQGNYDRAAGALDAYSKGSFPQLPDVAQSPGSGVGLTHRVGIHLPAGVSPDAGDTPRSKAEPAVNAWLLDLLPPASTVTCEVRFRTPAYGSNPPGAWSTLPVSFDDLGLEPIDLLYLQDVGSGKNLSALDPYVLRFFHDAAPRRPDVEVQINYATRPPGGVTFFELAAMIGDLRKLLVSSRPLRASDISMPNETGTAQDTGSTIDRVRIERAKDIFDAELSGLETGFIDIFAPLLDPEDVEIGVGNGAQILSEIDGRSEIFVARMSALSLFGGAQVGAAFVFDRRNAIAAAVYRTILERGEAWNDRATRYDELIDVRLPTATSDEERVIILHQAESLVSTTQTTGFANVAALQAAVGGKRTAFDAQHADLLGFPATPFFSLADLFDAAETMLGGLAAFDDEPPTLDEEVRQVVVLAEDMLAQAQKLHAHGTDRSDEVQDLLATEAATASGPDKLAAMHDAARVLFGEEFRVLPEFTLGPDQAAELQNCWNDRDQLLDHQRTDLGTDFPVDDWLYGIARVREKLAAWENVAILAEGFQERPPLNLTPLQLPYAENDRWVALAFPDTYTIDSDKLLYTAYLDGFDPTQPQCGVLVDEWTEVIPADRETTGMVFHYDRPNAEPPQTMLLVTPSAVTGAWRWRDVVTSLHEALDLARLRALEPDVLEAGAQDYARFLPATVATMTYYPVTIALDYAATAVALSTMDANG